MQLKDYQVYSATFEPCEVQGSAAGYRAVIHARDLDIVTYGVNFENTVKMARSAVIDMAHAMSYDELIPPGCPAPAQALRTGSPDDPGNDDYMATALSAFEESQSRAAGKSSVRSCPLPRLTDLTGSSGMPSAAPDAARTTTGSSDATYRHETAPVCILSVLGPQSISADCSDGSQCRHDQGLHSDNTYTAGTPPEQSDALSQLSTFKSSDIMSTELAEPRYVRERGGSRRARPLDVEFELPVQTALKFVIANHMCRSHTDFNKVASLVGCQRNDIEHQLDFYSDTCMFDLKLIMTTLGISLSDAML